MIRRLTIIAASLTLISCGSKAVPTFPMQTTGPSLVRSHGSATASLSFPIPSSDATHGFVPRETAQVQVSIHGVSAYQSGYVLGQSSFSASFPVPSGKDQFDVYLVDQSGQPLAHAAIVQNMAAGRTTNLPAVFHGVINRVRPNLELNPPVGTSKTLPFTVTAADAAGDTISGPVSYDKPLFASQKTVSAQAKLEGSRFVSPGDTLHVSYDGHLMTRPLELALSAPTSSSGSYGTRPLSFLAQAYTTIVVKGFVQDIAVAPDHVLWYGACGGKLDGCEIGNVDITGRVHKVARVHYVQNLTVGPDHNVWFTEGENIRGEKGPTVGRVTPSGQVTQYLIRPTRRHWAFGTYAITTGPDGNIWFTEFNAVDRITTKGKITSFPTTAELRTTYMVTGDGKVYFDVWEWSVGSCDTKGHINFYGSEKQPLGAPLVWRDNELLSSRGPYALTTSGTIHRLVLQDASIAAGGPSGTVVGAGVAQRTGLYGFQVSQLDHATLKGKTYPQISQYNGGEAFTKVVADGNGYFWAASQMSENGAIVRFRYDP